MAYGGLGWVYLAWDRDLSRWCVLKGLINSNDPTLEALAKQESQFPASLNHPNVVQVFTFLRHGAEGFIVMELVNGKNLLQIRRDYGGPLPVPTGIAYILNILPAFGYLDSRGLIYMDMKLENVMVVDDGQGNTVEKLIDLGAVRRVDDRASDLFATAGYSAPEVSADPPAPTPVSDLYSVARALALLVCDFVYQDDGFWNYTADAEAVAALVRSAPADADAEAVARSLVQFALDSGGMDSVTVAVARLASLSNGVA